MEAPLESRRILVIEDAALIAAELAEDLELAGAMVIGPAGCPARALDLAAGENIDAAILDVNLGGVMSYSIADRLMERHIPFLFTTGYDDGSLPARYKEAPRLTKPTPTQQVVRTLEKLLAN